MSSLEALIPAGRTHPFPLWIVFGSVPFLCGFEVPILHTFSFLPCLFLLLINTLCRTLHSTSPSHKPLTIHSTHIFHTHIRTLIALLFLNCKEKKDLCRALLFTLDCCNIVLGVFYPYTSMFKSSYFRVIANMRG